MILIIDNYDSFVYNLYQYVGELHPHVKVMRNNKISLSEITLLKPSHIILSPGPGHPSDAGVCVSLIQQFSGTFPILGICLGHQAIGFAFSGKIMHANKIMHGKQSRIYHNGSGLFSNIPTPFLSTRYHSLAVSPDNLPESLLVDAYTQDKTIMALRHIQHKTFGLQFHPESIVSEHGKTLIQNFLKV